MGGGVPESLGGGVPESMGGGGVPVSLGGGGVPVSVGGGGEPVSTGGVPESAGGRPPSVSASVMVVDPSSGTIGGPPEERERDWHPVTAMMDRPRTT
jgi:hypothetical protein